jgi:ribonuclease P protein component
LRPGCAGGALDHEKNVSAEQSASKANARFSCSDGHARRPQGAQAPSREGSQAADGLDPAEAAEVNERTPASLPKHARLRKRGEYLRVQATGRRHHTEHFVVLSAPGEAAGSRVGITVSARVGNAVVRNRVKRMLREILRASWRRIEPSADIVVIAKPSAAQATHAKAATELRRALGITGA